MGCFLLLSRPGLLNNNSWREIEVMRKTIKNGYNISYTFQGKNITFLYNGKSLGRFTPSLCVNFPVHILFQEGFLFCSYLMINLIEGVYHWGKEMWSFHNTYECSGIIHLFMHIYLIINHSKTFTCSIAISHLRLGRNFYIIIFFSSFSLVVLD